MGSTNQLLALVPAYVEAIISLHQTASDNTYNAKMHWSWQKKKHFESDVWKNNESINETITVLKDISLITKAKGTSFGFSGEHVKWTPRWKITNKNQTISGRMVCATDQLLTTVFKHALSVCTFFTLLLFDKSIDYTNSVSNTKKGNFLTY